MLALRTAAALAVLGSSILVLPGCLVGGHSDTRLKGSYVGPSTFAEIEPGVTRVDWVEAVMGKPSSRSELEDGSEIWKWAYTRTHESSGAVFLLFGSHNRREEAGATYVQVQDGVVVKKWRD